MTDYLKTLERAITTIENNLGCICVEDVAKEAGYTYYHLNRLFTAILGESIGSYIKKRRLADAAQKLLYTEKKVIEIAVENGFESSEAFSRAFKSAYKASPVLYRKNRMDLIVGSKKQLKPDFLRHIALNITVKPKIVEFGDILLAGIRGKTTLKNNVIPELWKEFWQIRQTIPNTFAKSRTFGICESGETVYTMSEELSFCEFVGIEVLSFKNVPPNIVAKTLKAGKYAVFTHKGSLKNIGKTYDYIWGTWIPSSREELDCREDFEVYDQRYLGYDNPETLVDICIPLK